MNSFVAPLRKDFPTDFEQNTTTIQMTRVQKVQCNCGTLMLMYKVVLQRIKHFENPLIGAAKKIKGSHPF